MYFIIFLSFINKMIFYAVTGDALAVLQKDPRYRISEKPIYESSELVLRPIYLFPENENSNNKIRLDFSLFSLVEKGSTYPYGSENWLVGFQLSSKIQLDKLLETFLDSVKSEQKNVTFFVLLPKQLEDGKVICYAYLESRKQYKRPAFKRLFNSLNYSASKIELIFFGARPKGVSSSDMIEVLSNSADSLNQNEFVSRPIFYGISRDKNFSVSRFNFLPLESLQNLPLFPLVTDLLNK